MSPWEQRTIEPRRSHAHGRQDDLDAATRGEPERMRCAIRKWDGRLDREAGRPKVDHGHRQPQRYQISVKLPEDFDAVAAPPIAFDGGQTVRD